MCARSLKSYFLLHNIICNYLWQEHPSSSPKEIQDLLWKQWSLANGHGAAPASLGGVRDDVKDKGEALEEECPAKKKTKKEKKVKDPLEPKKPACAYLLFFHCMKGEVNYFIILASDSFS